MISYSPFHKTLLLKKITKYQLTRHYLIPSGTINRIQNNKSITLKTLEHLCKILNCEIKDIVTFI